MEEESLIGIITSHIHIKISKKWKLKRANYLRGVTSEGGKVDHQQHPAGVLLRGEGDVGQPLDVLAGIVVEAPGVLGLGVTVLVLVCRDLTAQPRRFGLPGSLKYKGDETN